MGDEPLIQFSAAPNKWIRRGIGACLTFTGTALWQYAATIEQPFGYLLAWPILWSFALAAAFFVAAHEAWDKEHLDAILSRFYKWLWGLPAVLIAVALGLWAVVAIIGWFGTIPGWAAVIIGLLVLIFFRLGDR